MSILLAASHTLSWIAGGTLLLTAVVMGLGLHRRKLPVHERSKIRFFGRR